MRTWWPITLYSGVVLLISLSHDPRVPAAVLILILGVAGRRGPRLLLRALITTALFSGLVTLGYVVVALDQGNAPWLWVLRTNLRVLALTTATLLFAALVDPLTLVRSSRWLQTVVVLVLAQITTVRQLVGDARLALLSRSPGRPRLSALIRQGGSIGGALLLKAQRDLTTRTEAMTSRGFFLDADRD